MGRLHTSRILATFSQDLTLGESARTSTVGDMEQDREHYIAVLRPSSIAEEEGGEEKSPNLGGEGAWGRQGLMIVDE